MDAAIRTPCTAIVDLLCAFDENPEHRTGRLAQREEVSACKTDLRGRIPRERESIRRHSSPAAIRFAIGFEFPFLGKWIRLLDRTRNEETGRQRIESERDAIHGSKEMLKLFSNYGSRSRGPIGFRLLVGAALALCMTSGTAVANDEGWFDD